MPSFLLSPNMSLPVPVVGQEPGPQFASDINNSLTIVDQHTHQAGSGVPITPAAININANLSMAGFFLTSLAGSVFSPQLMTPTNNTAYVSGVDLFFVDGNGNSVQITSGGAVNATSSGISSGTASAAFVGGVLVVNSNTNTPANVQGASFLFGNNVVNSKYLTLSPPNAMGADYSLVLPSLPPSQQIMTLDASGNMSAPYTVDNSTITISSNVIQVKDQGITQSKLELRPLNSGQPGGIGAVGPVIFSTSSTSGVGVGLSVGIVTTGRPVMLMFVGNQTATPGFIDINAPSGASPSPPGQFVITRDGTSIGQFGMGISGGSGLTYPPSSLNFFDNSVPPGAHTYALVAFVTVGTSTITLSNVSLMVYEI